MNESRNAEIVIAIIISILGGVGFIILAMLVSDYIEVNGLKSIFESIWEGSK